MSRQTEQTRRITVPEIAGRKGGQKIVALTAYTTPMAALLDPLVDLLLVGDSLGMVVHGLPSTQGVTLEMMILHGQAVMRGSSHALVAVDLPFGTYEASPEQAFASASRLIAETGCQAVKLETHKGVARTIAFLVDRGIPVIGHVGLRPQASNADGGFKAKGRTEAERQQVLDDATAADLAGAFALVVEGVAADLADTITRNVNAPTIGIGASAQCDGQILVTEDMLGLFDWTPKFVRRYANLKETIQQATTTYADDIRKGTFPADEETYRLGTKA
ncbi:ketopantoate hydroxymethyltransferase [Arboricoccus pini]|uniref:3-methyl-2-oxobutanoate hydroxymethyltransferase n=1 Tax=Arboricoccus pini TaxID=1963835 RepID=A0A212RDE9_9PROT|nr:3-methyl-2-oxobutanoate hydroxymethyltransferase [Arboricoccus pini]SNB70296.1 ketopantoate hydroxymethyltransferase [Arboricoccus pini]